MKPVDAALAVVLALAVAGVAAFGSLYAMRVLSVAGTTALLALGYRFIFGEAGALSLAQGAFMGVGAYASAILGRRLGLGFGAALPVSIGLPVLLAALAAIPVLRLRTHYFALATLVLAQMALLAATQWEGLTGGANGIAGFGGVSLLGVVIAPGRPVLLLIWAAVLAGGLLVGTAARGRTGAAGALARADPIAAAAVGLDVARLRLAAFLMSAAFAGLAGSFYARLVGVVSPEVLGFPVMVTCLTVAVVGGRRRSLGIVAAAVLVTGLPEWVRPLRDFYLLGYGLLLLAVVVAAPDGLADTADRLLARLLPAHRGPPMPAAIAPVPRPPEALPGPLLEIEELARRFGGVRALAGVSLTLRPGEALGLIGPNGSGKSTLLNLVGGLHAPDGGRVRFAGTDLAGQPPFAIARAGIGRSFQTPALVAELTALDNVAVAGARSAGWAAARGEAMALLGLLGVAQAAGVAAAALPPATRRRVEIARALATRPRLLLLDEPAAGLDDADGQDLAGRLRLLVQGGLALLVVEHDLGFLMRLVDRLACLDRGRLVADGSPEAVRADPRVIEAYLGRAAPR